ncbi:MAG TPA: hypothetical protein VF869_01780 [Jatrophihabitantaceae bacterium]
MRIGRPPRATRWLTAAVGLGVAVAVVIIARPAGASTTVNAQLAFSGVVTQTSPTGGSVVGIHPGDSVDFKPATVPTEGLDALGFSLGDIAGNVLNLATGYQVVMHLPSTFPGGKRDVKLGACGGKSDLKVAFPTAGTYNFTWSAYSVNLLCLTSPITLDGNAAKDAGIALNSSNQWVGKVVAATDPPAGGISVQLPAVSASPNVGGVQLPPVGEPGATLPTITTGGSGSSPTPAPNEPGGGSGTRIDYQQPGQSVQDRVVPHGYGGDGRAEAVNQALIGDLANGVAQNGAGGQALAGSAAKGNPATTAGQPINLAANKAPAGQMPVLLSILAIIALSLVTATYARLYLLRRNVA